MELLLKSGADVKCLDERGDTPLHAAVRVDSETIVVVRLQSRVVRKPANANPGLKVNRIINSSCIKMFLMLTFFVV